ncbi:hypothetical protein GCM10023096_30990 [Nonomuraea ferruginea]
MKLHPIRVSRQARRRRGACDPPGAGCVITCAMVSLYGSFREDSFANLMRERRAPPCARHGVP